MSRRRDRQVLQELLARSVASTRAIQGPRFSIVIPTFNRAPFVGRAVKSVLRQMQPGDEVIVVDDGSSDDTPQVLKGFGDRIVALRVARGGAGRARNLGLRQARNELVAFLDSDDEWLPRKLDIQRAFMAHRPDVLYCFTNFQVEDRRGHIHHRYLDRWPREHQTWEEALGPAQAFSSLAPLPDGLYDFSVFAGDLYRWQLTGLYVLTDTLVVRREQAGDALHFAEDLPTFEDLECFFRLSRQGTAAFLDIETVRQRDHAWGRLSQLSALHKLDARIRLLDRHWGADPSFLAEHRRLYRNTLQRLEEQRLRALLACGMNQEARQALARLERQPWYLELLARLPVSLSLLALQLQRTARRDRLPRLRTAGRVVRHAVGSTRPQPAL
ncbi:MAG TPA: glycosyltransferase family 2 protein [Haliangium sp.]|nr:glycosyltransferase family 2 protein [Haliangium sp.]